MKEQDIRKQIDLNNKIIKEMFAPNTFTLNNIVAKLLRENADLQAECNHSFLDGYCVYCDKEEE